MYRLARRVNVTKATLIGNREKDHSRKTIFYIGVREIFLLSRERERERVPRGILSHGSHCGTHATKMVVQMLLDERTFSLCRASKDLFCTLLCIAEIYIYSASGFRGLLQNCPIALGTENYIPSLFAKITATISLSSTFSRSLLSRVRIIALNR